MLLEHYLEGYLCFVSVPFVAREIEQSDVEGQLKEIQNHWYTCGCASLLDVTRFLMFTVSGSRQNKQWLANTK